MYRLRPGQELVLASASPRRREMLARMGLKFAVDPAEVDEVLTPGEEVDQAAARLAGLKAEHAAQGHPQSAVLAADTLVALDGAILGKPADPGQARDMLALLSGREHQVVTGFCLCHGGEVFAGLGRTLVRFRRLSRAEIDGYVASGEPMGKAGAYAVQGLGAALVISVNGSYTNVVGLPLAACLELLLAQDVIEPAGGAS